MSNGKNFTFWEATGDAGQLDVFIQEWHKGKSITCSVFPKPNMSVS